MQHQSLERSYSLGRALIEPKIEFGLITNKNPKKTLFVKAILVVDALGVGHTLNFILKWNWVH